MNGLVRTAMDPAVSLLVAGETLAAEMQGAVDRVLEHAGRPAAFRQGGDCADEEGNMAHGGEIVPSIPQPRGTAHPRGIPMCRRHDLRAKNVGKDMWTATGRQIAIKASKV